MLETPYLQNLSLIQTTFYISAVNDICKQCSQSRQITIVHFGHKLHPSGELKCELSFQPCQTEANILRFGIQGEFLSNGILFSDIFSQDCSSEASRMPTDYTAKREDPHQTA